MSIYMKSDKDDDYKLLSLMRNKNYVKARNCVQKFEGWEKNVNETKSNRVWNKDKTFQSYHVKNYINATKFFF